MSLRERLRQDNNTPLAFGSLRCCRLVIVVMVGMVDDGWEDDEDYLVSMMKQQSFDLRIKFLDAWPKAKERERWSRRLSFGFSVFPSHHGPYRVSR